MDWLKQSVIHQVQRLNRNLNTGYLERVYQASYLDMASRTHWLSEIPIASPRGGTASFSLLYLLLTILEGKCVRNILEFGSGLSTSLFLQYIRDAGAKLTSIEDDPTWFNRLPDADVAFRPILVELAPVQVNGRSLNWYGLEPPDERFDLLLVDGPTAFSRSTQNNRLGILQWIPAVLDDEFIIIVDDSSRKGELRLVGSVLEKLAQDDIHVGTREIVGANSQMIICSNGLDRFLYI